MSNADVDLKKAIAKQKAKNIKAIKKGEQPKVFDLLDEIKTKAYDYSDKKHPKGKPIGVCKECKKEFEQSYTEEINAYTDWKMCEECTKKKSNEKQAEGIVIKYDPHPWQKDFYEKLLEHRFGIVAGGARSGKDYMSMMLFIRYAIALYNEHRQIHKPNLVPSFRMWIVSPTEKIGRQDWYQLVQFMPKEFVVSYSESAMKMQTIGGGVIEVRSAHEPEHLVGVGVDFCVITEAARIKRLEEAWGNIEDRLNSQDVGLGGKGGKAILNSSPLGKNQFYKMFKWGQKGSSTYSGQFFSVQVPTTANPAMAARYAELVETKNGEFITYEQDLRNRKGRKFLQDNLAMFLDSGGTVFCEFKESCVYDIYREEVNKTKQEIKDMIREWKEPKLGEYYRIGYDPATGSSGDDPAIVVREMSTNRVVNQINLYGLEGDDQLDKVAMWVGYYNKATVALLTMGSLHAAQQLRRRGIDVIELGEQGVKKRAYVQSLQACVTAKALRVLDDGSTDAEKLILQMEDYTEDENTGRFSNQTEPHDDFVSAMYAAFYDFSDVPEITKYYMPTVIGSVKNSTNRGKLRSSRSYKR